MERRNKNRGLKKQRVWQDAVELFVLSDKINVNDFEKIDTLLFRIENLIIKLIESLKEKRKITIGMSPTCNYRIINPSFQYSITPTLKSYFTISSDPVYNNPNSNLASSVIIS